MTCEWQVLEIGRWKLRKVGYRRILEEAKDHLRAVVPLRMVVMSVIIILRIFSA